MVVSCSQWPKLQGSYNIANASFPTCLQCYLFVIFVFLVCRVVPDGSQYGWAIIRTIFLFSKFGNRIKLRRVREKNCPVEFEYLWKRCRYIIFLLSYQDVKFFSSVEKIKIGHRANFWEIANQVLQTLFSHFRATFWFLVAVILIKYLT